ncbi:ABC transporter ATP-binding protein [Ralstonia pseudosolanacearum]|uniref:ABC transporter ATP-binding protein n=1 Tax=Ralstonia solanacearum TaxID=305 RepID=A0AA92ED53_RALSL|nr:ABC transporter ATP-binding protein [Ralstonia pseudosolanacearum]QCX49559.1 ABC transporter ATP-binding protein [Ralstonia pseudosolanacearum]
MNMLRAVFELTRSADRGRVRRGIALRMAEALFATAPYAVLFLAFNAMFTGRFDAALLTTLTLALLGCVLAQLACAVAANLDGFIGGTGMMCDLRLQIAEQLRRLPLGFYARRQTGDLSAVMAENVVQVEDAFTHLTGELCGRLAIAGLTGALLLSIDWRLGLLAFASVAAGLLLFRLLKRAAGRLGRAKLDQKAETNSRLLEFVQGIKVIRAFGLSAERFDKVFHALTRLRALSVRIEVVAGAAAIGFSVLLEIGFLLVLAQAFRFSLAGHLTHAMLVMFLIMSHRFFSMMSESAMLMAQLAFYSRSFDRIAALMSEPLLPEPDASTAAHGCAVEFRDVSFSHAPGEPTLRGVSFVARPDTVTALVGPSGAGKSTLAHLVARFHDVEAGQVLIGGVDVRAMRQDDLLDRIAIVFQDTYLLNDSIENNLRLARPEASDADLVAAARAACCHDFIMALPDGYRTVIGEGGGHLSGGERQRLSIARALLKDAPIVLLDEATASIDSGNELAIRQALAALVRGKTVLVIAHRLHTVADVDQILVLERGRVVERGRHPDLLAGGGLYARLWAQQARTRNWRFRAAA